MKLVEESIFTPGSGHPAPVPEWKRLAEYSDALPKNEALAAGEETDIDKAFNLGSS
jgi:hypothetical protein